jgi:hypothetical protein
VALEEQRRNKKYFRRIRACNMRRAPEFQMLLISDGSGNKTKEFVFKDLVVILSLAVASL